MPLSRIPLPRFPAPLLTTTAPRTDPTVLLHLVRRIAVEDHAAFADLYDALSLPLLRELESTLRDPDRAAGITCGTFVEVWTLARFHVGANTDVHAWMTDIVARRTADRQAADRWRPDRADERSTDAPLRPWWAAVADSHDRDMDLTLRALLVRAPRCGG